MKRNSTAGVIAASVFVLALHPACSSSNEGSGTGGVPASGGSSNTGGAVNTGGGFTTGGSATGGTVSTGGTLSTGGTTGGTANSGTGGALTSGGNSTGGIATGGSSTGGSASGGGPGGSASGGGAGGNASGGVAGSGSGGAGKGGGQSGGSAGTAGGGTTATGGTGNTSPRGSAAKFNCQAGATYGDPLSGVGSVQQIGAPQSDYFAFIEGPVWISKVNALFFSDNASSPSERIFKVASSGTSASLFVGMSGSNGLAVDNDNQIVAADQRNRRIARFDSSTGQSVGTPISTGSAKPNDVLVRSDGTIYFTDPDTGFYQISSAGVVSAAMKPAQGSRPNGIELSLDENTLYVGDVGNKSITKYTVQADGSVMTGSAAPFVAQTKSDTVDGMCVDCAGNVYAGTSNGVEVYSPEGMYIGTVQTGEASNCTFGGSDRKTLYVTSRSVLKYVKLNVPGLPD